MAAAKSKKSQNAPPKALPRPADLQALGGAASLILGAIHQAWRHRMDVACYQTRKKT